MNKQQSAGFHKSKIFALGFTGLLVIVFSICWFRSAPVEAQRDDEFSPSVIVFSENFDNVTVPALPAGWTTSHTGDIDVFKTVTTFPDTAPNAAFINDPNTEGLAELVSPAIALGNIQHKLVFRHFYQTDFEFDGGVLEISIAGGAFQDILAAGGTFVTGGYNSPLAAGSPLGGRQSWTGQQSGYITTEVTLPASTNNQSVRFRWRLGTDPMEAGTGWWIDNVQVSNAISGTNTSAISIPAVGPAAPYPSEINVANNDGFVTGVQVSLTNFSHASPDDVDLMLVAPNGRKVVLMSDAGGTNPVTNLNLFFTDDAASLPDSTTITSGNYKPTDFEPGDSFPASAPGGAPTGARLSAFNGSVANGIWQLFLVDDSGNNAGSINGGWTLFVQSSPDAIAIPDIGTAQPYASEKTVSGLLGTVTKATVTLSNFSHTSPDDVDIMLVSPSGRRIVLMSDVGGNTEVGGLNFTFDDTAASNLPDNSQLVSGTFKPTDFEPGDAFPAPAPSGVSGTTLNAFYGSPPNGVWKLFVVDDNGSNLGSVAGGWSINLQTSTTACAFTVSPIAQAFPITGGSGSFAINMPAGCSWSASTNSNFVSIDSAISGTGSGAINFSVATNMSGAREGFIEITNGVVTKSFQAQQPSGCPLSVSQSVMNIISSGGNGNITVTAGSVCSWQAQTAANWIQVTSNQQTGNGQASFTVSPNP
ncbi:MAG TPA: proprotein convertase P-domain-containing protein, partial [Pyrinomonadaceae bacterium]